VIISSSELAQVNPLRAWTRNGLLHIEGLTAGKPLSIFSATGALVSQTIPAAEETDIPLSASGMYIVQQGAYAIKITFNK